MKTLIAALFAVALLGATAAEAQISIHVGGHGYHHRHRVCEWHHHHRFCSWR